MAAFPDTATLAAIAAVAGGFATKLFDRAFLSPRERVDDARDLRQELRSAEKEMRIRCRILERENTVMRNAYFRLLDYCMHTTDRVQRVQRELDTVRREAGLTVIAHEPLPAPPALPEVLDIDKEIEAAMEQEEQGR